MYIKCNIINQMKEETLQESRFLGVRVDSGGPDKNASLAI